jgi:pyruvate formate lyase activating enzyme
MPVLDTCKLARELDIHIELTYLVIPGYNDSIDEIGRFCDWIIENLGKDVPVHFSRFHPDHNMLDVPRTPMDTMLKTYEIAIEKGILFPYLGNVAHGNYENTLCPKCDNVVIQRNGFFVKKVGLKEGKCEKCGSPISGNFL